MEIDRGVWIKCAATLIRMDYIYEDEWVSLGMEFLCRN